MVLASHATGLYPEWWEGRRFAGPTRWWVSNVDLESTRDNPQRILFGENLDTAFGTGTVPHERIGRWTRAKGITDGIDRVSVEHVSGGWSTIAFKAYKQGREAFQGETLHGIWLDEEPPDEIYSECRARISTTRGLILFTVTPLLGMTQVIGHFYPEPDDETRGLVMMDIADAEHFTRDPKLLEETIRGYPPHEREARTQGKPLLGSGRIFPVAEADYVIPATFTIPDEWPQLVGMDFGWDHPTAAVRLAHDRTKDVIYVVDEYRQSEQSPAYHASAIRRWGDLPVMWPRDGYVHDPRSGMTTADLYRQEGLRMWHESATFKEGGYGTEDGIMEMLDRMRTGRWKVLETCVRWREEAGTYHRKKGKIVKERDDLLSASRIGMMMVRYARAPSPRVRQPAPSYDWQPGA